PVEMLRVLTSRDGRLPTEHADRADALYLGLAEGRDQLEGTLSGGDRQMLRRARAVQTEPRLLLLDEISTGLAPMIVADLYELVGQLAAEGMAILVVEQFARTALAIADYSAVMVQGRIERVGQSAAVADVVSAAYF